MGRGVRQRQGKTMADARRRDNLANEHEREDSIKTV